LENSRQFFKYFGLTAVVAAVCLVLWYFHAILFYLAVAFVVSLIGRPFWKFLCNIRLHGKSLPSWVSTVIVLSFLFLVVFSVFMVLSPLVWRISAQVRLLDADSLTYQLSNFNEWAVSTFPRLGYDFKVEEMVVEQLKNLLDIGTLSSFVSSVSGFMMDMFVAAFSIAFMSFFLLNEQGLLTRTALVLIPDKYGERVRRASSSISALLSRYFIGLCIESFCIFLLNSLGLTMIAKMETETAIILALLTGIFNVVPYVGPLAGEVLAAMMGLVTFSTSTFSGSLLMFLIVTLLVCLTTQLVDNFLFQPIIYSNSVKAHPLEIFIVILMGAHIGGIFAMLVAVPTYTMLRVMVAECVPDTKLGRVLSDKMK